VDEDTPNQRRRDEDSVRLSTTVRGGRRRCQTTSQENHPNVSSPGPSRTRQDRSGLHPHLCQPGQTPSGPIFESHIERVATHTEPAPRRCRGQATGLEPPQELRAHLRRGWTVRLTLVDRSIYQLSPLGDPLTVLAKHAVLGSTSNIQMSSLVCTGNRTLSHGSAERRSATTAA
jgi:hypothetical protein